MSDSSLPIFASRRARSGQLDIFPWNGWKFRRNMFKTAMEDTGFVAVDNSAWETVSHDEVNYNVRNAYITDKYRPYLNSTQCLLSILRIHNETVNIWLHLIGFILFLILFQYDILITLPKFGSDYSVYVIYMTFTSSCTLLFFLSTVNHIFCCHPDELVVRRWMGFDQFGLWTAIIGCYVPGLRLALWCFPEVNWLYSCTVIFTGVSGMILLLAPASRGYSNMKYFMTILLASTGFIPIVHWVSRRGLESEEVQLFLPFIMKFYASLGTGFIILISKLPERFSPGGWLNLAFNSHNLWHAILLLSFVHWRKCLLVMIGYRLEHLCYS